MVISYWFLLLVFHKEPSNKAILYTISSVGLSQLASFLGARSHCKLCAGLCMAVLIWFWIVSFPAYYFPLKSKLSGNLGNEWSPSRAVNVNFTWTGFQAVGSGFGWCLVAVKGFAGCGMGSCSGKQLMHLIHASEWTCVLLCLCGKGKIAILRLAGQPCCVTAPKVLGRESCSKSENAFSIQIDYNSTHEGADWQ